MTPLEINTAARQRLNAVGDSFYSDAEIYTYIYDAQMQLAREAMVIENRMSTTTVAGTQSYAYPTRAIRIKRITYDGKALIPITFREDDSVTLDDADSTTQGTPEFYFVWDDVIYLRPIPDAARTLEVFTFSEPDTVTALTTLDVPGVYHPDIVNYVLSCMCAKNQNYAGAQYYRDLWDKTVAKCKVWARKRLRGDSFGHVQDEEMLPNTLLGGS